MDTTDNPNIIKKGIGFVCFLCPDKEPQKKYYIERHFLHRHQKHSIEVQGEMVYICTKLCIKNKKGHYHCPCPCNAIFDRFSRFKIHKSLIESGSVSQTVSPHHGSPGPSAVLFTSPVLPPVVNVSISATPHEFPVTSVLVSPSVSPVVKSVLSPIASPIVMPVAPSTEQNIDFQREGGGKVNKRKQCRENKNVECPHCFKQLLKTSLKIHIQRCHSNNSINNSYMAHEGSCVDLASGIFLVAERKSGIHHPIHVQKYIVANKPPIIFCESKNCRYEKTIAGVSGHPTFECDHLRSVHNYKFPCAIDLGDAVLDVLISEKRIKPGTKEMCLNKMREANSWGCSLINEMSHSDSDRYIFMSLWVGYTKHYCLLGRVVLTFDRASMDLVCGCNHSSRQNCDHKPIAKWFLRSMYPDIFLSLSEESHVKVNPFHSTIIFSNLVEYQFAQKSIPFNLPSECLTEKVPPRMVIFPKEDVCFFCNGKLLLEECKGDCRVLSRFGFEKLQNVWVKVCSDQTCSTKVYYSETCDGIFNFNNKLFLTYDLLKWLRNAQYLHNAVSREVKQLKLQYTLNVSEDQVRLCLYVFLALTNDQSLFSCPLCGYHPVILTFDVDRKCNFKLEKYDESGDINDCVDAKKFWDDVRKHSITRSLGSKSYTPSLRYWAPYIGEHSRKSNLVYNTEFRKGVQDTDEQQYLECLSEESLEDLFDTDLSTLKELCKQCGMTTLKPSKSTCVTYLKSALKARASIDKFFFKVWHSSGGLLTTTCPHGIVYAFKALLKPESARDISDILLSLKHPPNIVISDIPHMLASHMNKRVPDYFHPYGGRVADPTEHNIDLVEKNNFKPVSFPWLGKCMEKATPNLKLGETENFQATTIHPITLINQYYSLYDKFHQGNTSQKKEYLRRTGLVKELDGVVTETAEQLNSYIKKSLYFLDVMKPLQHILVLKSILGMRNQQLSSNILKNRSHHFDEYGRAKIVNDGHQQQPQQQHQPQRTLKRTVTVNAGDKIISPIQSKIFKIPDSQMTSLAPFLFHGLQNVGSTCWFNSVMVAALHTYGAFRFFESLSLDAVWFLRTVFPVVSSLHLRGEVTALDSTILTQSISTLSPQFQVGRHEDAAEFFRMVSMFIDNYLEDELTSSLYEFKVKDYIACYTCDDVFQENDGSIEMCLSVSLGDQEVTLMELISQHFDDEMVTRSCLKCKTDVAGKTFRIEHPPSVFAVEVKRYERGRKSTTPIIANKQIDLSLHMQNPAESTIYKLRAMISHKGPNCNSGHYVCTVFDNGVAIRFDDSNVAVIGEDHDHEDGYLFIYERVDIVCNDFNIWWSLTFVMAALNEMAVDGKKRFNSCLKLLWSTIFNFNLVSDSWEMGKILCSQISRQISLKSISDNSGINLDGSELVRALMNLIGVRMPISVEFLEEAKCPACNNVQRIIRSRDSFVCDKVMCCDIKEVFSKPSDKVYVCCHNVLTATCTPIHLPRVLVLINHGQLLDFVIKSDDLCNNRMRYPISSEYTLAVALEGNDVRVFKDSLCYSVHTDSIQHETFPLLERGIGIVVFCSFKEPVVPSDVRMHTIMSFLTKDTINTCTIKTLRLAFEVCTENVFNVSDVSFILEGLSHKETPALLKHGLGPDVCLLFFQSFEMFENATLESLCNQLGEENFILIRFPVGIVLVDQAQFQIYEIGSRNLTVPSSLSKILNYLETVNIYKHGVYPTEFYNVYTVTKDDNNEFSNWESIETACQLIEGLPVERSSTEDVHVLSFLSRCLHISMPRECIGRRIEVVISYFKERFPFFQSVLLSVEPPITYSVAQQGRLFEVEVTLDWLLKQIENRYLMRQIGTPVKDVVLNVVNFLMEEKEYVKLLCSRDGVRGLMWEEVEMARVIRKPCYSNVSERYKFVDNVRDRMRSCVPGMLVDCMSDSLNVILTSKDWNQDLTSWECDLSGLLKIEATAGTYFGSHEYIEAILMRYCVVRYLSVTLGNCEQDINRLISQS